MRLFNIEGEKKNRLEGVAPSRGELIGALRREFPILQLSLWSEGRPDVRRVSKGQSVALWHDSAASEGGFALAHCGEAREGTEGAFRCSTGLAQISSLARKCWAQGSMHLRVRDRGFGYVLFRAVLSSLGVTNI